MTDLFPSEDDARDVRTALGTLVSDEPPPVWSVSDDVARGRALQRRRRTRIGSVTGLVAVVALIAVFLGPLRPGGSDVVAPVVPDAPAVAERIVVDDALAQVGLVVRSEARPFSVDVSGSTDAAYVVAADGAGDGDPSAVLELRTFTVTTAMLNVHSSQEAYLAAPPSSALRGCTVETCGEVHWPTSVCALATNCPISYWVSTRAGYPGLPVGTLIEQMVMESGLVVESVVPPLGCEGCDVATTPFLDEGKTRSLVLAVGRAVESFASATPEPSATALDVDVEAVLEGQGWTVDHVASSRGPVGSPAVTYYSLHKTAQKAVTASLTLVADPRVIFGSPEQRDGGYLSLCAAKGCGRIESHVYDCATRVLCPDEYWTLVTAPAGTLLPAGTLVMDLAYDDGTVLEGMATPVECATCNEPLPLGPFLDATAMRKVLRAADKPDPLSVSASPTETPSPVLGTDSASVSLAKQSPCTPSQITVVPEGSEGATGTMYYWFVVSNTSDAPCGLVGPASTAISPVPPLFAQESDGVGDAGPLGATARVVLLSPGQSAGFYVSKFRCDEATDGRAASLALSVNGHQVLSLPFPVDHCASQSGPNPVDPGNTVRVSAWGMPPH